jgi:mannan endo-1,4-beta-mannosidase
MIPMPELHDVTGNNNAEDLKNMARYWARGDVKSVIDKYKKYILVNIANEWGDNNLSDRGWRDAYKEAITIKLIQTK